MNILDKIIGEEGFKTDIRVSIHPTTYVFIFMAIFGGFIAGKLVSSALIK